MSSLHEFPIVKRLEEHMVVQNEGKKVLSRCAHLVQKCFIVFVPRRQVFRWCSDNRDACVVCLLDHVLIF